MILFAYEVMKRIKNSKEEFDDMPMGPQKMVTGSYGGSGKTPSLI
jgi:hypothetical protein